jgi:hypothetical protein
VIPGQGIELRPQAPLSQFKGPGTVVQASDFQIFMSDWLGRVSRTVSQNDAFLIRRVGIYQFQ